MIRMLLILAAGCGIGLAGGLLLASRGAGPTREDRSAAGPDRFFENVFFIETGPQVKELNALPHLPVHAGRKIFPRAHNTYHPSDTLSLYLEIRPEDGQGTDLHFQFILEETRIVKAFRLTAPSEEGTVSVLPEFSLEGFPAGKYILQVTAIERLSRKSHFSRLRFSIR